MPRCEYSYYVALLFCNFIKRGHRRHSFHRGPPPPRGHLLEPPLLEPIADLLQNHENHFKVQDRGVLDMRQDNNKNP